MCNHCKAVLWEFLSDEGIRTLVIPTHQKTHRTHKSIWINESSVNPKSTSNQSSKPCTVLLKKSVIPTHQKLSKVSSLYLLCSLNSQCTITVRLRTLVISLQKFSKVSSLSLLCSLNSQCTITDCACLPERLLRISTKRGDSYYYDINGSDILKSQSTTQSTVCNHYIADFWEFQPDHGVRTHVISTDQKFSKASPRLN